MSSGRSFTTELVTLGGGWNAREVQHRFDSEHLRREHGQRAVLGRVRLGDHAVTHLALDHHHRAEQVRALVIEPTQDGAGDGIG
jgi:hypothetical protein